jgi:hypothetical protein
MLTFSYRGASEPCCDYLFVGASIDGLNYCGHIIDGDHNSGYTQDAFDLSNIQCPDFPSSFLGNANVTIVFYFSSDDSVTDVGFTVDDIALTTDTPPPTDTPTATLTSTPTDTPTTTPPTHTPTNTMTPVTPPPAYLPIILRALAPPTPTPTLSPLPTLACSDIEPNNDIEHSKQLTTINSSCIGSFQDQLNDPLPDDYYWIQPNIGQHIIVDLTSIQSGANYDIALILRDNLGKYGKVISSEKLGQDPEHFDYLVTNNQRHYIRVRAIAKSPSVKNTYTLTVAIK